MFPNLSVSAQPLTFGTDENSLGKPCEITSDYVEPITAENINNLSCSQIRFRIEIIKQKMRVLRDEIQKIKARENPYANLPSQELIEKYTTVFREIKKATNELEIIYNFNQFLVEQGKQAVLTEVETRQILDLLKTLNLR